MRAGAIQLGPRVGGEDDVRVHEERREARAVAVRVGERLGPHGRGVEARLVRGVRVCMGVRVCAGCKGV